MLIFGRYYILNPNEIECISTCKGSKEYPYRLQICLKSGRNCAIDYTTEKERDNEKLSLISQLDKEKNTFFQSALKDIKRQLNTISNRQQKLMKQLKQSLEIKNADIAPVTEGFNGPDKEISRG